MLNISSKNDWEKRGFVPGGFIPGKGGGFDPTLQKRGKGDLFPGGIVLGGGGGGLIPFPAK